MLSETPAQYVSTQVITDPTPQATLPVDVLLDRVRRAVQTARIAHPELQNYHLHDVALRVADGQLVADLHFRR